MNNGPDLNGTYLRPHKQKPASRIGLSADVFQTLDSGFRRNDGLIRCLSP